MTQYSVHYQNDSTMSGAVFLYLTVVNSGNPVLFPVVWQGKYVHPTTMGVFRWTYLYDFAWAETGKIEPGIFCDVCQIWEADLQNSNQVTLTRIDQAFSFTNQTKGGEPGILYMKQDDTIPADKAAVGIGMDGRPVTVAQAQPCMTLAIKPELQLWIGFGDFKEDEIIDPSTISTKTKITFPTNITSMKAVLQKDNTWVVTSITEENSDESL